MPAVSFLSVMLLLLLSHFSPVRLCATPYTAAHHAPPSLGFSSKNTGVGCHFLLQCMKVKSESEVPQSCLTLRDPMDCSSIQAPPSIGFSRQEYWSFRSSHGGQIKIKDEKEHIYKKGSYSELCDIYMALMT